jgi:K+/H+ antiporter YhaU regulatory subunit KhtT
MLMKVKLSPPRPTDTIEKEDILVLIGLNEDLDKMGIK